MALKFICRFCLKDTERTLEFYFEDNPKKKYIIGLCEDCIQKIKEEGMFRCIHNGCDNLRIGKKSKKCWRHS